MSTYDQYILACNTPSDINQHLRTLHDLAKDNNAQTVVELGVRTGNSTLAWLLALEHTGGHLWMVDLEPAPENLVLHPQSTFIQGDDISDSVLSQLPDQADIIFIDSYHTYDHTKAEIAKYESRLAPGGFMVFHDTSIPYFSHDPAHTYPVRKAVDEWIEDKNLTIQRWENCSGLTIVSK